MTTPNLPWATTDPADLPQGVIAPSQLGVALQDHTQGKYVDLASSRFPGVAKGTSAGSPANVGGPLGFVTNVFSNIVSRVATADPATITKPDDIVSKAGGFFGGLPLIQTAIIEPLSHLIAFLTGGDAEDYDSVDELKSALLNTIPVIGKLVDALQGIATSGALSFISGLFNLRWAQVDHHEGEIIAISAEQAAANARLDDLESFAGTGITTPLATSIGGRDIVTFADSQMNRLYYKDSDANSPTGSTTPSGGGNHSHTITNSVTTKLTDIPAFTQVKRQIDIGFIRGGQDADVPIEVQRIITGADTGFFGIDAWYLGIYVYDIANARIAKIWDSGDVKSVLAAQRQRYNLATGLTSKAKNDQLIGVATLQIAPGVLQTPRGIGCLFQTGISEAAGVVPQARAATLANQSTLPNYINLADLTWDKEKVLWASLGPAT